MRRVERFADLLRNLYGFIRGQCGTFFENIGERIAFNEFKNEEAGLNTCQVNCEASHWALLPDLVASFSAHGFSSARIGSSRVNAARRDTGTVGGKMPNLRSQLWFNSDLCSRVDIYTAEKYAREETFGTVMIGETVVEFNFDSEDSCGQV
jgi:hypothetical protein